jgi:hypothetical protein
MKFGRFGLAIMADCADWSQLSSAGLLLLELPPGYLMHFSSE